MRQVSRTHRVALDWLFDRINLDPQNSKSVTFDTKHQLADILTNGNVTRDEWNNLPHLSNISHFSSTRCTKNFSLISCSTMAKRIQHEKEEERVVSKSRPALMNISSFIATSFSTASSPIASKSPGMPTASGKPDSRKGESVAQNNKAWEQPLAHGASSSVDQQSQKNTEATWDHYLQMSPDTSHCMEAVFSRVREIYGRQLGDPMEDLNVNLATQGMFMNTLFEQRFISEKTMTRI